MKFNQLSAFLNFFYMYKQQIFKTLIYNYNISFQEINIVYIKLISSK